MWKENNQNQGSHEMKVRVINNKESEQLLQKANVPRFIINEIMGNEFESDGRGNIYVEWAKQPTEWSVPEECLVVVG